MENLNILIVQCVQHWEEKEKNIEHIEYLINQHKQHVDLIVLPEMFQTSFSMNVHLAEDIKQSDALKWLKNCAISLNSAIYTSIMCKENQLFYNRGVFVFPNGEMIFYDKRKLFSLAKENQFFQAGEKQVIVHYKGWNILLQICFDLRFPELSRNFIKQNHRSAYDICIYTANWPEKRIVHWNALLKARAIENQCFVIGVNRVGVDGLGNIYSGESQVINPFGQLVFTPTLSEEKLIPITLNYTEINEIRSTMNFLLDNDLSEI